MSSIYLSGFTFIKNGLTLGYPIAESIESIAPLCDEVIINVGFDDPMCEKDDGTYKYLTQKFSNEKFRFLKSYWDPELTSQGLILAQQTNIALKHCQGKYCQYIQGDEALHEEDLPLIRNALNKLDQNSDINGLIFQYLHFYGNTNVIKHTRNTYRREVRLIRNHCAIKSYLDAQGFKNENGDKVKCLEIAAKVYHYGWARESQVMNKKVQSFGKLYHGKDFNDDKFEYQRIWGLRPFKGTHPAVMKQWIENNRNNLDILNLPVKFKLKDLGLAIADAIEYVTGYRLGEYKNFIKKGSLK